VYKFPAVILSVSKIRDNTTRIVLLSREYGKITAWWNKKNVTGIDIGDIAEVLLSREWGKNTLKSVDIKVHGWSKWWWYDRIIAFLETIQIVGKMGMEWQESRWLYEDLSRCIQIGKTQDMSISQYTIFQMRILKSLGVMNQERFRGDSVLRYIYENISHTPLERVLLASPLKIEHLTEIRMANLQSLEMLK
jgi:hypothetical protein